MKHSGRESISESLSSKLILETEKKINESHGVQNVEQEGNSKSLMIKEVSRAKCCRAYKPRERSGLQSKKNEPLRSPPPPNDWTLVKGEGWDEEKERSLNAKRPVMG